MAFNPGRPFELRLKHGTTVELIDPIIVTGNGGREIRRRVQKWPRFLWTFPSRVVPMSEFQEIRNALSSYATSSFRLQDPTMGTFRETRLVAYNNTNGKWVLSVDLDGGSSRHPYFNPTISELKVRKNGVLMVTTGITMTTEGGYPVMNIPGTVTSDNITVVGPFYPTVRFEGTLAATTVAMRKAQWRETTTPPTTPTTSGCNAMEGWYVQLEEFKLIEVWEQGTVPNSGIGVDGWGDISIPLDPYIAVVTNPPGDQNDPPV